MNGDLEGVKLAVEGGAEINAFDSGFQKVKPNYWGGETAIIYGISI